MCDYSVTLYSVTLKLLLSRWAATELHSYYAEALCDHLLGKPGLYLHDMKLFLIDEFGVSVPKPTISDALHRKGWSKKTVRQKAKELNLDLRDDYCHLISEFTSYHLVYVSLLYDFSRVLYCIVVHLSFAL